MDLVAVGEFIKSTGFPIFVALFVLFRLEPMISALREALVVQTVVLSQVAGVDYEAVKKLAGNFSSDKSKSKR